MRFVTGKTLSKRQKTMLFVALNEELDAIINDTSGGDNPNFVENAVERLIGVIDETLFFAKSFERALSIIDKDEQKITPPIKSDLSQSPTPVLSDEEQLTGQGLDS